MARVDDSLYELKESAKWSLDVDERKKAIRLLAGYGPSAIQSITEIRDIAAYDEIKKACIEAIKTASSQSVPRKTRGSKTKRASKTKKGRRKK
jgi:hypothetical protein